MNKTSDSVVQQQKPDAANDLERVRRQHERQRREHAESLGKSNGAVERSGNGGFEK